MNIPLVLSTTVMILAMLPLNAVAFDKSTCGRAIATAKVQAEKNRSKLAAKMETKKITDDEFARNSAALDKLNTVLSSDICNKKLSAEDKKILQCISKYGKLVDCTRKKKKLDKTME